MAMPTQAKLARLMGSWGDKMPLCTRADLACSFTLFEPDSAPELAGTC